MTRLDAFFFGFCIATLMSMGFWSLFYNVWSR